VAALAPLLVVAAIAGAAVVEELTAPAALVVPVAWSSECMNACKSCLTFVLAAAATGVPVAATAAVLLVAALAAADCALTVCCSDCSSWLNIPDVAPTGS
jgi:hypothetical protein